MTLIFFIIFIFYKTSAYVVTFYTFYTLVISLSYRERWGASGVQVFKKVNKYFIIMACVWYFHYNVGTLLKAYTYLYNTFISKYICSWFSKIQSCRVIKNFELLSVLNVIRYTEIKKKNVLQAMGYFLIFG